MEAQLQSIITVSPRAINWKGLKCFALAGVAALFLLTIGPSIYHVANAGSQVGSWSSQRGESVSATRSWFAAINQFLATGENDSLAGLLSDDFVDHNPFPGAAANDDGFLASLEILRQQYHNLYLQTAITGVDDDRVAISVSVLAGEYPLTFADDSSSAQQDWTYSEQYRVLDGQIVERWGADLPFALEQTATSLSGSLQPLLPLAQISRLHTGAGQLIAPGGMLILVESGAPRFLSSLGISVVREGEQSIGLPNLDTDIVATAGDIVVLDERFVIETDAPADLLVLNSHPAARYDWDYATAYSSESSQPDAIAANANAKIYPFAKLSKSGNPTLTAVATVSDDDVDAISHQLFAVPSGEQLPVNATADLVIVKLVSGEARNVVDGSILVAGDSLVLPADLAASSLLITQHASVEIVTVSFESAEAA